MIEHFTVVGFARARAAWFREVSRWASSAALPMELVKCVSIEELRARVEGGGPCSAVLVDAGLGSLDRDLVDRARRAGCPVIAVDDGSRPRDWSALDVSAVLPVPFDRSSLLAVLHQHGRPSRDHDPSPGHASEEEVDEPRGRLVVVTGLPGPTASVTAMALAHGMSRPTSQRGSSSETVDGEVVLADLSLEGRQALLHDAGDVVPGLSELVEAHRGARLSPASVRELTFGFEDRHYRLLAGLRRHHDWAALRTRATESAVASLRATFGLTVAEVTPEVEGEDECGSVDVEERNHLARCALGQADVIVLVAGCDVAGTHALLRSLDDFARFGVDVERILPVMSGAPKPGLARMRLARELSQLVVAPTSYGGSGGRPSNPLFFPSRRELDRVATHASAPPQWMCDPLTSAVTRLARRVGESRGADAVTIRPGSLGSWPAPG